MSMYADIVSAEGEVLEVKPVGFRRSMFGYVDVVADVGEVSMTKQEFKDECNINNIMAQYQKTGLVNHLNKYEGRYDDVSGAVSYQEAHDIMMRAESMFMSVPSSIRAKFDNDPGKFLEFVTDPANSEEMRKMGLMKEMVDVVDKAPAGGVDAGKSDGSVAGAVKGSGSAGNK